MNIALKEAEETLYWLELLSESNYLETERAQKGITSVKKS